jgi:transcriptional regulator with XRE-family HTH domain
MAKLMVHKHPLYKQRVKAEFTREEIAEATNYSVSYVAQSESGSITASDDYLNNFCNSLNLAVSCLKQDINNWRSMYNA